MTEKLSSNINDTLTKGVKNLSVNESLKKGEPSKPGVKIPKGTRDSSPSVMVMRESLFDVIVSTFKKHGAEQIDTPVFELKETLTNKYGEDSKLIYDLADQGGELLSMRYDLTVPLARYVAMNKIDKIKRFHIAKVYRRDNPAMNRGRFREFYQCDYDICGLYDPIVPDVECCKVVTEILSKLELGDFVAKINHRKILEGYMKICGVEDSNIRPICSSIDKLDKVAWSVVYEEMVKEKGLPPDVADKIKTFVEYSGGKELIETLRNRPECTKNACFMNGLEEMELFFEYAKIYGISDFVKLDLSLARGLDYYTGCIYEFVITRAPYISTEPSVGSVAAGGRYDNLIGMFNSKNKQVPAVGISIGVERLLSLLELKIASENKKPKTKATKVLVTSNCGELFNERLKIARMLWDAEIPTEIIYKKKTKLLNDFQFCENYQIPICVIIGKSEYEQNLIIIRNTLLRTQENVPLESLVEYIRSS